MPTLIDSLIIELGLDPSKFEEGQKKAVAGLVKMKDEAAKAGKEIEEGNKKAAESYTSVKNEILSMFAALVGTQGVKSFLGMAKDTNDFVTALSVKATTLGQTTSFMTAFGKAAAHAGGNAESAMGSISGLVDSLNAMKIDGAVPMDLAKLLARGGVQADLTKSAEGMFYDIGKALSNIAKDDPSLAGSFGRRLGLEPAAIDMMIKQGDRLKGYLNGFRRFDPSEKDKERSLAFTDALSGVNDSISLLKTKIVSDLDPALTKVLKDIAPIIEEMAKWAEKNDKAVIGLAGLVAIVSGAGIVKGIASVLALANAMKVLAASTAAADAAGAAATTGGLAGLLAMAGRFGLLGAAGYALYETVTPQSAGEGENEIARQRRYGQGNQGRGMIGMRSASGGIAARDAAALIRKVGGTEQEAAMLGAIAAGESGGNARAHNTNAGTGDNSYGLWQINMIGGLEQERLAKYGLKDKSDLYDPETNARVALAMARAAGGYKDWSVFKSGAYLPYLSAARDGATGATRTTRNAVLPPMPSVNVPQYDAATAADFAATTNNDNRSYRPMTVHVGGVNVHAPGADANGVANDIDRALSDAIYTSQLDSGPQ